MEIGKFAAWLTTVNYFGVNELFNAFRRVNETVNNVEPSKPSKTVLA
jgi:hypothetical protein